MTQLATQGPIEVRPQPDIYTLLLIVAILALLGGVGAVLWLLMSSSGYGLSLGQIFEPLT